MPVTILIVADSSGSSVIRCRMATIGSNSACRKAYRLEISLKESAQYIVPVSRSAVDQIKALRQQASGKFISASYSGVYQFQEIAPAARTGRAFRSTEA